VLGFLSAGAVLFYKLDDGLMARIETELKTRKAQLQEATHTV
jgi:Na+/melibiose symporter-like transporter